MRFLIPERDLRQLVALGLYSRAQLQALRRGTGIQYDHLKRGILHLYTNAADFEAARAPAELTRGLGLDRALKTPEECVAIEPALAASRHLLAGGTYSASDAHRFTQALAERCAARGDARPERVRGDAYVLALGSYSPRLARPLGIGLAIYPAKGYSVTMPVKDPACAWSVSLTDEAHKLVYSRLGERLRIAGTAEFAGYDTSINRVRCDAILRRVRQLFPEAGEPREAQFWAGLGPAMPSNVPYIGRTRTRNLYLNCGHGTLGWTHARGSGRALADLIGGRRPEVAFAFC